MKIINIEFYLFSIGVANIASSEAFKLMEHFKDLELFPQLFNDILPNGKTEQRFMFVNGITGLSVKFHGDRIVLSQSHDPITSALVHSSFDAKLNKMNEALGRVLDGIDKIKEKSHTYNRLSILTRSIVQEQSRKMIESIKSDVTHKLPWVNGELSEVNLRTCQEIKLAGEDVNSVVAFNNGFIDIVQGNHKSTDSCLLIEVDVNSSAENKQERFNKESVAVFFAEIKEQQVKVSSEIQGYIDTLAEAN